MQEEDQDFVDDAHHLRAVLLLSELRRAGVPNELIRRYRIRFPSSHLLD
jgi:hypothetical protein